MERGIGSLIPATVVTNFETETSTRCFTPLSNQSRVLGVSRDRHNQYMSVKEAKFIVNAHKHAGKTRTFLI